MRSADIADIKRNLSHYVALVEQGEEIQVCRRNMPVARVVPASVTKRENLTELGCGRDTGRIVGDITEPAMSAGDLRMFEE